MLCYNNYMTAFDRRLRKLEANRPDPKPASRLIDVADLSPEVLAMWIETEGDVNMMNLDQLDAFEAELRRLA